MELTVRGQTMAHVANPAEEDQKQEHDNATILHQLMVGKNVVVKHHNLKAVTPNLVWVCNLDSLVNILYMNKNYLIIFYRMYV